MRATPQQRRHERDEDDRPEPAPRHVVGRTAASKTATSGSTRRAPSRARPAAAAAGMAAGASHSAADGARHALMIGAHVLRRLGRATATGEPRRRRARRRMTTSATARLITQPGAHEHRVHRLVRRAEEQGPREEGEHLRAGAQSDRVGAGHPGAVRARRRPRRIATNAITMPAAMAVPKPSRITNERRRR